MYVIKKKHIPLRKKISLFTLRDKMVQIQGEIYYFTKLKRQEPYNSIGTFCVFNGDIQDLN